MGPDAGKHVRNILIILALAAAVWLLPGGRTGTNTIGNLLTVILFGGFCFLAYRLYMENRIRLLDLPERTRAALYGSFALLAFALVATGRFWRESGVAVLLWFVMIGVAVYGLYSIYRAQQEY